MSFPPPLTPYDPLLINVCLTGAVHSRDDTPHVPIALEQIVEDAIRVADAGAQIVHLHARDRDGIPTYKAAVFEQIIRPLRRDRPELILCVSTSGRYCGDIQRRAEVLQLDGAVMPDLASLAMGSMNFLNGPSITSMDDTSYLLSRMNERGIRPEVEIFDHGMINYARYLAKQGELRDPACFNLILGNLGTANADIETLGRMVKDLPRKAVWLAAGIGRFQLPVNTAAIVAGGGVRVGLEDNVHYDMHRCRFATNVELVERTVRIAAELGRRPASCGEARSMMGLRQVQRMEGHSP